MRNVLIIQKQMKKMMMRWTESDLKDYIERNAIEKSKNEPKKEYKKPKYLEKDAKMNEFEVRLNNILARVIRLELKVFNKND